MKKVLITWWNKWIWLETTKLLLKKWFYIIILARDFSDFEITSDNIKTIKIDLSKKEELATICRDIWKIDILINNAWVLFWKKYNKYSQENIDYIMQLNLLTPIKLIEYFLELNPKLRVVNTSSMAARIWDDDLYYGVTKAWITNMTKSFANQKWRNGLIINSVAPWPINNNMLNSIYKEKKESIPYVSLTNDYNTSINVAKTIAWLASESPNTINWCTIDINDWMYFN